MITNAPQFINWNYTCSCNFECRHCYSRHPVDEHELSTREMLAACDNIGKSQVLQVNLGGGEPIMRPDCHDAIRRLSGYGVRVVLSSNGWLLSRGCLLELQDAGLMAVHVSVDHAIPEKHDHFRARPGSFARALGALRAGRRAGLEMHLSTVLTSWNWDVMECVWRLAVEEGAVGLNLKRFRPVRHLAAQDGLLSLSPQQEEHALAVVAELVRRGPVRVSLLYHEHAVGDLDGCPCGRKSLAIRPNGAIAPCVYAGVEIGNVLTDPLAELWQRSPVLQSMRDEHVCLACRPAGGAQPASVPGSGPRRGEEPGGA